MKLLRAFLCVAFLIPLTPASQLLAQTQQPSSDIPTFRSTSSLVFLDVTVVDKKGQPVVTGLTKDDFTITEDKKPQRIFSFEAPETHTMNDQAGADNPDGSAPVTIFVLDLLNSSFEDFAFIRDSMQRFLKSQPSQLKSPAELMVIGNESLELIQGYTRNRDDLLFALKHVPATLPYKMMSGSFFDERFVQSIQALQQIALQSKGIPGRKNIIWVGHGGPGLNTIFIDNSVVEKLNRYVHQTTNMLVDARVSLFVIYPGLKVQGGVGSFSAREANASLGNDDPFAGDINFGVFVNETGGNLFYNRNDVDALIQRSQILGSEYYTLTYQPHEGESDGKFRRIRVALRDSSLKVVTKAGYFAPDAKAPIDPQQQTIINLSDAVQSTIPFTGLDLKIVDIIRHPDTRTADFIVRLQSKNLSWQPIDDGRSKLSLILAATSLSGTRQILASKLAGIAYSVSTQNQALLAKQAIRAKFTIRIPNKTRNVRVAVETEDGGRIGSTELDRAAIDAAPEKPTPEPQIVPRPVKEGPHPSTN